MTVPDAVRESLRSYQMLSEADRVICALSGGPDSVCLADVMLMLSAELGLRVECAHFNHLLRGEESARDERFAAEWCAERGVTCHMGRGAAAAFAAENRMGVEEAARTLRYAFLDGLGDASTRIATAHQADDQAETVLMNLLRGSGLKGLCGIPPVRGRYIRPLLEVPREEILAYLAGRGLDYVLDSSNLDTAYRRNRIRHEVMPVLRELNPAFTKACGRAARLMRRDEELLAGMAGELVSEAEGDAVLSAAALRSAPAPLAARALRRAAGLFEVRLEEKHVEALMTLAASAHPSAERPLPGGLTARREYELLRIGRKTEPEPFREAELSYGAWTELVSPDLRVYWGDKSGLLKIHGKFTTYFFKKDRICGTMTVRPRREGDMLRLPGRPAKSLKKWMLQERIPACRRDRLPVFADERGILAVYTLGADERASAAPEEADSVLVISERT